MAGLMGLDQHPDGLVYRYEAAAPQQVEKLLAEPAFNGRVSALMQEAYGAALALIQEGREPLLGLAQALDREGMLKAADVVALLARPGTMEGSPNEAATPVLSGAVG